jgi:hypothetical protein
MGIEKMDRNEVQKQIEGLKSADPMVRLRSSHALGKLELEPLVSGEVLAGPNLYLSAVRELTKSLDDPASPLIRAESACTLGKIGGLAAARSLLYRLNDILALPSTRGDALASRPDSGPPLERVEVLASVIAAIGHSLSQGTLKQLSRNTSELELLREHQQVLLRSVATEEDHNLRVAAIETLVTLAVTAGREGVDLDTDLTSLLCAKGSTAVLAAIALLKATVPSAGLIARSWHSRTEEREPDSETSKLLREWQAQLGECAPGYEVLLEWLDAAAVLWDLGEAVQNG